MPKLLDAVRAGEPHALPGVVREEQEEREGKVEEVAVDILEDEREGALAEKSFARFADGAVGWVGQKAL